MGWLPTILHTPLVIFTPARVFTLRDVRAPGDDGVSIDKGTFENLSSADIVIGRLWERLTKFVGHLPKIGDGRLVIANKEMDMGVRLTFLVSWHVIPPINDLCMAIWPPFVFGCWIVKFVTKHNINTYTNICQVLAPSCL